MQETMGLIENGKASGSAVRSATGKLCLKNGKYYVDTFGGESVLISESVPASCKEGDLVAAVIKENGATVTDCFGSSAELEPNLKALLRNEGLDVPFEADAVMQAKATAFTEITALMAKRTDLRGKTIVTLSETEGSRNECGFSVEIDKDGHYILGVHTTDVAQFVDKCSALERAVFTRCKTAMLPGREIPMLPESITKGPCFLEVGEDRLAISYFLTVDEEGTVKDFSFCESVIKTAANCLFGEIEALFLDYDTSAIMPLRKAYASVFTTISNMFNLGAILQSARVARGGADIDKAEKRFLYSRHGGKPVGVVFRKDSDPKRLVREFLSLAGQKLAEYLYENEVPSIYRIQEEPTKEAVDRFRSNCELVGVNTAAYNDKELFAGVSESIRGMREEELLLSELRALLPETTFAAEPHPHFIHNTQMYTRFAYPLNRCADFAIQRIVKWVLAGLENPPLLKASVAMAIKAAAGEGKVNKCEKIAEDLVSLDCLKRDKHKTYSGLVKSINADGATVLLDNGCIGVIEAASASIDAKEEKMTVGGKTYRFGSEISVRFLRADFETATLYVEL